MVLERRRHCRDAGRRDGVPRHADARRRGGLRAALLAMDPFDFERHMMSFFETAGLYAVVKPRPNGFWMDGYAAHPEGLIVLQCKRYVPDNKVRRPKLMEFASVIRDEGAWRGCVVTTSAFSRDAIEHGVEQPEMVLIDFDAMVR